MTPREDRPAPATRDGNAGRYPVELWPPDLARWRRGNTGIDYVHRLEAARPGPHVMITALVHGNELCGALALDWLLRDGMQPRCGTLTLAFCNVAAFERFDPAKPDASRYVDEDFNRVWSPERLDGKGSSIELERARELRPAVAAADLLLDLHSMHHVTPPLILSGPHDKGLRLALALRAPRFIVRDTGHAAGRRMRDYGSFGDAAGAQNALLVECGQHWEYPSARVAGETLVRFLEVAGIADPAWTRAHLPREAPPPQRIIEVTHAVTIASDSFRFAAAYCGLETIARAGTIIAHDGDALVTTPYDDCVLIMPGLRLEKGLTAVRFGRYVQLPSPAEREV